jgi:CrcB protein
MPWSGFIAVGGGAAVGAWLRWGLGIVLNPVFPTLPLGTLAANLIGGLFIGFAMELLTRHTVLPPEARLLVVTGFLGGLTTFSTFSAEVVTLLLRREWLWGSIAIGGHVLGSLAMTIAGIAAMRAVYALGASA